MSYDNNLRGALWHNKNRQTDKHPHFQGNAEIDGVEYWVSGWHNDEGGNKPVVSLAFKAKEVQANNGAPGQGFAPANLAPAPAPAPQSTGADFDENDIPF